MRRTLSAAILIAVLLAGCAMDSSSETTGDPRDASQTEPAAPEASPTVTPWGYTGPWGKVLYLPPQDVGEGYIRSAEIRFGEPLHDDIHTGAYDSRGSDIVQDLPPGKYAVAFSLTVISHLDQDNRLSPPSLSVYGPEGPGYGMPGTTWSGLTYQKGTNANIIIVHGGRGTSRSWYGLIGPATGKELREALFSAAFATGEREEGGFVEDERLVDYLPNRATPAD